MLCRSLVWRRAGMSWWLSTRVQTHCVMGNEWRPCWGRKPSSTCGWRGWRQRWLNFEPRKKTRVSRLKTSSASRSDSWRSLRPLWSHWRWVSSPVVMSLYLIKFKLIFIFFVSSFRFLKPTRWCCLYVFAINMPEKLNGSEWCCFNRRSVSRCVCSWSGRRASYTSATSRTASWPDVCTKLREKSTPSPVRYDARWPLTYSVNSNIITQVIAEHWLGWHRVWGKLQKRSDHILDTTIN